MKTSRNGYAITKQGKEAEADLSKALPWLADRRVRDAALLTQGQNRETNLKDVDGALTAYHIIVDGVAQIGSSDQYGALHGIARIHTQRGQFDEALKTLRTVNLEKVPRIFRTTTLLAIGDTQLAAGKKAEALATYKAVADDAATEPRFKKTAEEKMAGIK
jgi:tetratricopeptide (TPR) repeat protein